MRNKRHRGGGGGARLGWGEFDRSLASIRRRKKLIRYVAAFSAFQSRPQRSDRRHGAPISSGQARPVYHLRRDLWLGQQTLWRRLPNFNRQVRWRILFFADSTQGRGHGGDPRTCKDLFTKVLRGSLGPFGGRQPACNALGYSYEAPISVTSAKAVSRTRTGATSKLPLIQDPAHTPIVLGDTRRSEESLKVAPTPISMPWLNITGQRQLSRFVAAGECGDFIRFVRRKYRRLVDARF